MNLVQIISNFIQIQDESTQSKLLAGCSAAVTLYSVYKIECKIRSAISFALGGSFLSMILVVILMGLLAWLFFHRKSLIEFLRNIDVNQIKKITADNILVFVVFILVIGGFFLLKKERPTTQDIRENGKQLFSIADASKYDTKIYLADNFTELSDEFNDNLHIFIKQLNKKLSQRGKLSKTNETVNSTSDQNYIDSEFIFLFTYLNRTLPFFIRNETIFDLQAEKNDATFFSDLIDLLTQLMAVVLFVFVSSYLTLKFLTQEETKIVSPQLIISPSVNKPLVETKILKENSCQTSNTSLDLIIENKTNKRENTLSQSLIEVNKIEPTNPLHSFDLYGSKSLLSKASSVLTITNPQEEDFLRNRLLKELTEDSVSNLLNWMLCLGIENLLNNDMKTTGVQDIVSLQKIDQPKFLNKMMQTFMKSAKQQLKFDEIFFKSVDTLPPKFSNIQTVVNATDNLTLKANIEFGNIDTKIEFKKSRRLYDLKLTKARAQITVVLSQKNQVLTLECSVDPQSEFFIAFEKNPNIEPDIMQYLETLIQTAAKLTILNLELNSSSKSQNVNSSKVFKTTKPMAPQINQGLKGSSPAPATTASAVPLSTSATNFNTNVSPTATNKMTFSSLVADKNILNVPSSATTPSSAPALAPVQQQEPAPVQTQLLSASAAGATSPAQSSQNEFLNNILQNNLANNNNNAINTNNTEINETFYQPDYFHDYPVSKPYEELQQTENAYSENPEVSNIQAMAAAAAAVNAKQLRNAVNEKRLLVRLLKATNLTNCEEPYIVVELDYPMQKHITDIHRDMSSINEQFFFDIIANSEELTFSIFDRAKDYGNDLVGEAAMPVSDLCSSPNGKRVIQLHRYGQTKTGSITAEFVFIEPSEHSDHHESRMMRSTGQQSRGSVSPYDQNRNTLSPERRMLYRDEMMTSQQADQFQEQQTNPDMFSEGQYSPRNQAINMQTQQHRSRAQAQPLQQQPQQSTLGRVINRNYLQTQSQNYRAKTLDARGSTEFAGIDMVDPNEMPTLDKRKRSISRSLKSLFNRSISSTSKIFGNKRDKSYDVPSNENEVYDTHSVDHSSKKIGSSIKKLFASKKKGSETEINKMGQQQQQRMGGGPAISISRPDESMIMSNQNQMKYLSPNAKNDDVYLQSNYNNSQIDNSKNFTNNLTEDAYNKQPVILRRRYRSP